jgi:NhaP-type Na+/H+ or K+/H+ antiporter
MTVTIAFLLVGMLLIGMALAGTVLSRLPITTSMVYLLVGIALGPLGIGLLDIDAVTSPNLLLHLAEGAVIISLFTAGLKLRVNWRDRRWVVPLRLASIAMVITVALVAVTGVALLGLSVGAAIVLGAVLAPTDPVLAAEVEVESPSDQDRLRFGLTGEAGLNDGTAFPFVMLGLGFLGLEELGETGWRWIAIDLVWSVTAGIVVGVLLGLGVGRIVVYLRHRHATALGLEEFLTLGLIAVSYGTALLIHTYGFLAVFAAGLALRRMEHTATDGAFDTAVAELEQAEDDTAIRPETASLHLTQEVLGFNEQIGRIAELVLMVLVGSLLDPGAMTWKIGLVVVAIVIVIRPVAVMGGLLGASTDPVQRRLMAWFGLRGIGSIYYLMYALEHELSATTGSTLLTVTTATIALSVLVHGASVTPVMTWYDRRRDRQERARKQME